jgi:uncharacterized protein YecE (DUF72 family)
MSEPSLFPAPADVLRSRLASLASRDILIGTSSWKYAGWLGQVYNPERYSTRGKFSQKKFERTCLAEYAETFPIVCGDFSFYQFPPEDYWRQLFAQTPASFRFALKAPQMITVKRFSVRGRHPSLAGLPNESFLDVGLLEQMFLKPLSLYGDKVALLIFEFGSFSREDFENGDRFAEALDGFLARLPKQCRYAVEIRNREWLIPAHFECLRQHSVAHVFNAWTRMPPLDEQIRIPAAFTTDFTVTRALLRAGRTYEQAVEKFSPYSSIQEPNPTAREAMRSLIEHAVVHQETAYIFVNNRLEGNAPGTIGEVIGALD